MNVVAMQGESNGLGADPAGAVQGGLWSRNLAKPNQAIEGLSLFDNRSLPVSKDKVVARDELIVEALRGIRHIESVSAADPAVTVDYMLLFFDRCSGHWHGDG